VFEDNRLVILCVLTLFVSTLISFYFVQRAGGFSVDRLGLRRRTITRIDIENDQSFESLGEVRQLSKLSWIALVALILSTRRRFGTFTVPRTLLAVSLGLSASVVPWFTNTRAELLSVGLSVAVAFYLSGKRIRWTRVAAYACIGLVLLQVMTVERSGGNLEAEDFNPATAVADAYDNLVLNRNMYGIGKTTVIIHSVPQELDYANGASITSFIVAPIPRSVWQSKPLVTPGPIIGREIFGTRVTGVPPGLTAELYWNFGFVGIVLGSALAGWVLSWVGGRGLQLAKRSDVVAVIYSISIIFVGKDLFAVSVGRAVIALLLLGTMSFAFLYLATRKVEDVEQSPNRTHTHSRSDEGRNLVGL